MLVLFLEIKFIFNLIISNDYISFMFNRIEIIENG